MTTQRPKVTFESNVPVELALHWPDGKIVAGRFGDQVIGTLVLPASFAASDREQIRSLFALTFTV